MLTPEVSQCLIVIISLVIGFVLGVVFNKKD